MGRNRRWREVGEGIGWGEKAEKEEVGEEKGEKKVEIELTQF